ncbi:guanylyltransferase [Candidatus Bathyarchaeota archaeon]|nr:MAG: guanylyltransferase [Candidatus Bathyarchaeota archaeon]
MNTEQKLLMQESYLSEEKISQFKENEIYSQLKIPKDFSFIVRLDGWKFQFLCKKLKVEKPFDIKIAKCLVDASKKVFRVFSPSIAYVISDEINLLFVRKYLFNGRIEKINSILSGLISSSFSLNLKKYFKKAETISFDSRVIVLPDKSILDYFAWRQLNGWRNHNNAYAYWLFRKLGYSPKESSERLKGLKSEQIHEILFKHGINLSKTPAWQRRGIIVYKETYEKETDKAKVKRRKITENWNLPPFTSEEGKELLRKIITESWRK